MPITEKQEEARQKRIGCSDLPKLMGLSKYGSSYDLYLEKMGVVTPYEPSAAAHAGTVLETSILQEAEKNLGRLRRNQLRVHSDKSLNLGASCDAILVRSNEPVEAKTHGLFSPPFEEWGDEGTDEVPPTVMIQVNGQMMCVGEECRRAHVWAFIGWRGFVQYEVPRDDRICSRIEEECRSFWQCVANETPPDSLPTLDVIKHLKRTKDAETVISEELAAAWLAAKEALTKATDEEKETKAAILAVMGEAEIADAGEFGRITYKQQVRRSFDSKAFKNEHPDLAEEYTREGQPFRVFRHSKPKAAKKGK